MKLVDADLLKAELGKELEKFARENEISGKPALFVYIYDMYLRLMAKIDSLPSDEEEPVSDDFKKFEVDYLDKEKDEILCVYDRHAGLVDGANWQKVKTIKSACEYLQQHREEVQTEDNGIAGWINNEFIDNFRKTMELS